MKYYFSLLFVLIFCIETIFAQRDVEKEPIGASMIDFHYTLQIPSQDMADRFGINSSLGAGYTFKTKNNWLFGFELNYLFSQNVKNSDSLLWNLEIHPGEFIISNTGGSSEIRLHERGVDGFIKIGKLIPVLSPNPNSGFFATIGLGYLGYKIKIDNVAGKALIFSENNGYNDYIKGYDRLSGGFALQETIGYMLLSNNRVFNFYVAADFEQGFTKNKRKYEFDKGPGKNGYTSTATRHDFLSGIRIGWIFTIYQRPPKEFYYD